MDAFLSFIGLMALFMGAIFVMFMSADLPENMQNGLVIGLLAAVLVDRVSKNRE